MKLHDIQNNFIDLLYLNKSSAKDPLLKLIKNGKMPTKDLFNIYRNNLYTNLFNALRLTFSMVYSYLGKDKFEELSMQYIMHNRSNSGNLDDYGHSFIQSSNNLFLKDLASFEMLKHKCYLAKDCNIININALKNLTEDKLFDLKFKINPSCFLFTSKYNLLAKQNALKETPKNRDLYFVIYRQNFEVKAEKISKTEYYFISGIFNDLTLYEIYVKYKPNIELCLQKFISNGVLFNFS